KERETGIEPATSSLGSWHSTAELLPLALLNVISDAESLVKRSPQRGRAANNQLRNEASGVNGKNRGPGPKFYRVAENEVWPGFSPFGVHVGSHPHFLEACPRRALRGHLLPETPRERSLSRTVRSLRGACEHA